MEGEKKYPRGLDNSGNIEGISNAFSTGRVHPPRTMLPGHPPASAGVCPHAQRRTPCWYARPGVPRRPAPPGATPQPRQRAAARRPGRLPADAEPAAAWREGKNNNSQPNVIRYLTEVEGHVPWTWWSHDEVGHTDEAKKEMHALFGKLNAFDTPKPERLLFRIIEIASNPGDLILDSFAGSGTTGAVTHKMGRKWIMVEFGEHGVRSSAKVTL
jgi:DNA methylase